MTIPNLKYVTADQPGYTRVIDPERTYYLDEYRKIVDNPSLIKRFQGLVIPPNWKNVWICKLQNGHLQATGRDDRKRKQYRYHPLYVEFMQSRKFDKLVPFAQSLPKLRKEAYKNLNLTGWPIEKVIGLMVVLLDEGYFRIGNDYYTNQNNSYGLSTLRRKHIADHDKESITFEYKGKKSVYRKIEIEHMTLARMLKRSAELPGYEIFRYKEGGKFHNISSDDVNGWIKHTSGEDFSCKDFRTWGANVLSLQYYHKAQNIISENPRKQLKPTVIKEVAKVMGNTASVCENYYVHPKVVEAIENESLPNRVYDDTIDLKNHKLSSCEKKVLEVIQ